MTGSSERVVYSWDSCVFLAFLMKEADKPLDDIRAVAHEIETGAADLFISTIVLAELLEIITDAQLASEFREFTRRPNVQLWSVDPRVARETARFRSEWKRGGDQPRNVKVPDAIVLTTASLANVTVLHSFDDNVLRFDKSPLVNHLSVTRPKLASGQKVFLVPSVAAVDVATTVASSSATTSDTGPSETGSEPANLEEGCPPCQESSIAVPAQDEPAVEDQAAAKTTLPTHDGDPTPPCSMGEESVTT